MYKLPLILFVFLLQAFTIKAQDNTPALQSGRKLPNIEIRTISGERFNTAGFSNAGRPIIINFWATNCKPCIKELSIIADLYDDWQTETGVKIIAVSTDDSKTISNLLPFVNGKGWDYEVYNDPNGDFKRAMNVNMIPHTFILNANLEIVWQHVSYSEGDELKYIEIVRKLVNEENIIIE